jgi:hypothetical protein
MSQRPMPDYPQRNRVSQPSRRQDESPEAVLITLGTEIRHLSGERPFSEELVLMEQVFVLLLEGFRRRLLPDGLVGLVPPQSGSIAFSAPVPGQNQAIVALRKAGMGWVAVDGQAALCFPARPMAA